LKYRHDIALGECLANELIKYFLTLNWTVEIVVPVPLGVARLENRGYNQAALLARPLALATSRVMNLVLYSDQKIPLRR
jgi:predicted amidophosphoribosyltransferase